MKELASHPYLMQELGPPLATNPPPSVPITSRGLRLDLGKPRSDPFVRFLTVRCGLRASSSRGPFLQERRATVGCGRREFRVLEVDGVDAAAFGPEPPNEVRADETPGAEDQDLAGHGDVDPALVKNGAIRPWMRRKATVSQPMSLPRQSSAA